MFRGWIKAHIGHEGRLFRNAHGVDTLHTWRVLLDLVEPAKRAIRTVLHDGRILVGIVCSSLGNRRQAN
jgi:hypothetical protein